MAEMEKAYNYIKFVNKKKPALNQTNLDKISTAIDTIDNRVIELNGQTESLKEDVRQYSDESVRGIGYIKALGQFYYWTGDSSIHDLDPISPEDIGAVTAEELDTRIDCRHIVGQIEGGGTSKNLEELGISSNLTVLEVFNKLPGLCIAVIQNNAHGSTYTESFPTYEGAAQLLYRRVFNRGTILFLPLFGQRVWVGKILDSTIEWIELAKSADMAAYLPLSGGTMTGPLAVQGTITASTFNGNASTATSALQAESAKALAGWADTRDAATKPNDYNAKLLPVGIKRREVVEITDGGDYVTLIGIRGWKDSSGGKAHEFGFTANGKLYHRVGNTDTWEPWREIAHVDDLNAGGTGDATTKVSKSGDTMTGNLEFSDSGTSYRGIKGACGSNDAWRVMGGATGTNAGFLELATADDGSEPVYVSQYTGDFSKLISRIVLLDEGHNTSFPGVVGAKSFYTAAGYAQISRTGLRPSTLQELVENIMFDTNARSGAGNANIGVNILTGISGWHEYLATWQNPYNQDNYDIGLTLVMFQSNSTDKMHVIRIDGKNGSYTVTKQNYIEFGSNGSSSALQFIGAQTIDAWSGAETITFPNTPYLSEAFYIIVGEGASSTSSDTGWNDYGRVIFAKINAASGNNTWVTSTLGSYYSGSTTRFSVDKTAVNLTINVPKGSYASIKLFRLKCL